MTNTTRTKTAAAAAALLLGSAVLAAQAAAPAIPSRPEKLKYPSLSWDPPDPASFRVPLRTGPIAYLVPDSELPLVNVVVLVRTGQWVGPAGKEGLEDLTGYLITKSGTATKTAEQLDERTAFLAAQLNSSVGETQGSVSLNLLAKDLDEGLQILREVLTAPRFQDDRLALRKQQMLQEMKQRNDDSAAIELRERGFLAMGEKFFANAYDTEASVSGLTKEDVQGFHRRWFHPANFVVAASGDFDRAAMTAKLEKLFADWPFRGDAAPPIPTDPAFAAPGVYLVDKDVPQGRVSVMLPGAMRDDPDFFPAVVMNDILGGGGFTSRITNRVRSDEGLAYSAGSAFSGGVYWPGVFRASFQSKSPTVSYATSIVLQEIQGITDKPVSAEELATAKTSFIETLPRSFATKSQIANLFAQDELTGRYAKDPGYWKAYRKKIEAVTAEDVQRVAKRFLDRDKLVILVVGKKEEILKGDGKHEVSLPSLAGGRLVDVPLRDPLTMRSMGN
jgi:predicted Zn-dependent peptidase